MSHVTAARARENFSEVLNQVAYGKERVVVSRRKRALAAVVPIEDFQLLEEIEDRIDLEEARKVLRDIRKKGTVPWETIKEELRRSG